MKILLSTLLAFTFISCSYAQSTADSIAINFHHKNSIHLGDVVKPFSDKRKYIVCKISPDEYKSVCLNPTEYLDLVKWEDPTYSCSRKLSLDNLEGKIVSIERTSYLERKGLYDEFAILKYKSKDKVKIGILNYVSIYCDSVQMSFVDESGTFEYETIGLDHILEDQNLEPKTKADTLLWLKASMKWRSDADFYSTSNGQIGQFNFNADETFTVNSKKYINSDERLWKSLVQEKMTKVVHNDQPIKVDAFNKYYWKYDGSTLHLWGTGNFNIGVRQGKSGNYYYHNNESYSNYIELSLVPLKMTQSSCTFKLIDKNQIVHPPKSSATRSTMIRPEYSLDSIPIFNMDNSHVRFGDVISLKDDDATYLVKRVYPIALELVNTKTDKKKTTRKSSKKESFMLNNVLYHEKIFSIDSILFKNHKDFLTIKQLYPIHTKVLVDNKRVAFIKKNLYDKELHIVGKLCDIDNSTLDTIPFGDAVLANQKYDSECDILEYINASQHWKSDRNIINLHSSDTGSLKMKLGDEITYHNPAIDHGIKNNSKFEGLTIDFYSNECNISFGDIDVRSKGRGDFSGTWFLSDNILNVWVFGMSTTRNPENTRSNNSQIKASKNWAHKIQFEVSQIGIDRITYKLIGSESVLVNKIE